MSLRALVDKHYQQNNTKDYRNFDEVFSPDVETTMPGGPPVRGREPFLAYSNGFHSAFPDGRVEALRSAESADTIFVEGRYTGTHTGPMAGPGGTIPPTGKKLDLPFCDVFQVRDGRVVSHRLYFDQVGFMQQLGLMPGASASST